MLDPQILNKNLEEFKENLQKREIELDLDVLIELDDKRRKAKFEAEQVRAEQNKLSKEIAKSDKKTKDDLLPKATRFEDPLLSTSIHLVDFGIVPSTV
jgi:seryl-tRNA synthetase